MHVMSVVYIIESLCENIGQPISIDRIGLVQVRRRVPMLQGMRVGHGASPLPRLERHIVLHCRLIGFARHLYWHWPTFCCANQKPKDEAAKFVVLQVQ